MVYNKEIVYNFKTKYKEGFTASDIDKLLVDYPELNKDKFDNALCGITCDMRDEELVIYHCDIHKAMLCGLENRDLKWHEWD